MAVDWDNLNGNLDSILEDAANKTDAELGEKISSVTKLTQQEIKTMCPEPGDAKKLLELIQIVNSAESKNSKINQIVTNSEKFGKMIIAILSKVI